MSEELRSALVVMHPGTGTGMPPQRRGEVPPDPAHVDRVVAWFRGRGFETGPFVGISFAISGSVDLFREVLGETTAMDRGVDAELPMDALGEEVAAHVAAIAVTGPPDFGPGNP